MQSKGLDLATFSTWETQHIKSVTVWRIREKKKGFKPFPNKKQILQQPFRGGLMASEHCNTLFSQGHCRFYHPPHTNLGPAEPAEYGRRFQSHMPWLQRITRPYFLSSLSPGRRVLEDASFCRLEQRKLSQFLGMAGSLCSGSLFLGYETGGVSFTCSSQEPEHIQSTVLSTCKRWQWPISSDTLSPWEQDTKEQARLPIYSLHAWGETIPSPHPCAYWGCARPLVTNVVGSDAGLSWPHTHTLHLPSRPLLTGEQPLILHLRDFQCQLPLEAASSHWQNCLTQLWCHRLTLTWTKCRRRLCSPAAHLKYLSKEAFQS